MTDEQHNDKASMLAALKILAREKGDVSRLKAQLSGAVGEVAASDALGTLKGLGVLDVKASVSKVPTSLRSKGDSWIRNALQRKLMLDDDIEAAIAELPPEGERATVEAQKKWPSVRGRDERDRSMKLMRFLLGRGFAIEAAQQALRSVAGRCADD